MPSWSHKRQLLYLLIPLILTLGAYFFVYTKYIYTPATCSDNLQNGTETGVDCGGTCSLICQGDALAPVVFWARSFQVTGDVWNTVAYIQNPNGKSGASTVPYEFRLYDQNNTLIVSRRGSIDILPHKTFAVFEGGINTSGKTVKRTEFEFTGGIVWQKSILQEPPMTITNDPIENGSTTPKITGTIFNPTLQTIGPIELVALILDGRQNAIGVSKTVIDPLQKGESNPFVFTWPKPFPLGVEVCQTPSDVMLVLDRSGSMQSQSKNPPQPLTDVKNTAIQFISALHEGDQAGMVSFATTATHPLIDHPLTSHVTEVENAIQSLAISTSTADQNTNIADGLQKAMTELGTASNTEAKKVIILLTDGDPTAPTLPNNSAYPSVYAESIATNVRAQGILIYTIGLGSTVNADFLKNIAGSPDRFFSAPNTAILSSIYRNIANSICVLKPNTIEILSRIL